MELWKRKTRKLIVEHSDNGYLCSFEGETNFYGWGTTEEEAITAFILERASDLRLEIVLPNPTEMR